MTIKIFGLWGSFPCFRNAAEVTSVRENSSLQEPGTGRSSTVSESRGVVRMAASEVQTNTDEDSCITQSTSSKKKNNNKFTDSHQPLLSGSSRVLN